MDLDLNTCPDPVPGIGQPYECNNVDLDLDTCPDPVPGIDRLTRGVDVTRLDLLPIGNKNKMCNFKINYILYFTCKYRTIVYQDKQ